MELYTHFSSRPDIAVDMMLFFGGMMTFPTLILLAQLVLMDLGVSLPWFGEWQELWNPKHRKP